MNLARTASRLATWIALSSLALALTAGAARAEATDPLSYADTMAVLTWVASHVASSRQPFCYRQSENRDAGVPPEKGACPSGREKDGVLCYKPCKSGFRGVGPVCWEECSASRTPCAAGCAQSGTKCASSVGMMILTPVLVVASIAALVLTAGAGDVAIDATEDAVRAGTMAGEKVATSAAAKGGAAAADKLAADLVEQATGDVVEESIPKARRGLRRGREARSDSGDHQGAQPREAREGHQAALEVVHGLHAPPGQLGTGQEGRDSGVQEPHGHGEALRQRARAHGRVGGYQGLALALLTDVWIRDAVDNFDKITTPTVVAVVKRQFAGHPEALQYIKEQYAKHYLYVLIADNVQNASNVVVSTVGALIRPACSAWSARSTSPSASS